MFKCISLLSNKKNKFLEQERKITRWLINERRDSISQYFSQDEFTKILERVNDEFNGKMKHLYPSEKDRYKTLNRINTTVTNNIRDIYQKVGKEAGELKLHDLNKTSEMILPFATLRDEANKELENYMESIIKDGRTQLTQAEFQKYKELKSKVDEYENMRLEKVEELNWKKKANNDILESNNIKDEYNFLFTTEPMSEEFMLNYFPSLKK